MDEQELFLRWPSRRALRTLLSTRMICCDPRKVLQMRLESGPKEGPDDEAIEVYRGTGHMLARLYLRASTDDQDASRARRQAESFAAERGLVVAGVYIENASGASLARPELFRLISDSKPGDVLLVEQIDRLSRLSDADRKRLRNELDARQIRIVALDLPTSWVMTAPSADDFAPRMFAAVNAMLLDVLAAVARKDYEDRRRRQAQGIEKAKAAGKFRGRPERCRDVDDDEED